MIVAHPERKSVGIESMSAQSAATLAVFIKRKNPFRREFGDYCFFEASPNIEVEVGFASVFFLIIFIVVKAIAATIMYAMPKRAISARIFDLCA